MPQAGGMVAGGPSVSAAAPDVSVSGVCMCLQDLRLAQGGYLTYDVDDLVTILHVEESASVPST